MSRGKPRGIRRKIAREEENLAGKLGISIRGDLEKFPETALFENIRALPALFKTQNLRPIYSKKEWKALVENSEQAAKQAFITAVISNDAEFFERLSLIAKFHRNRTAPVDPLGAKVCVAVIILQREDKPITVLNVLHKISGTTPGGKESKDRRWVRPDGGVYEESEIRRALKDLKIPIKGRTLKVR